MSYKTLLLGRHGSVIEAREAREEPAPLNYIDYRNQQALRAWRERYSQPAGGPSPGRRRTWLSSLRWVDSPALIR